MKYRAIWIVKGRELLILPRSKKTTFFSSIALAERALDRRARRMAFDTHGIIKDASDNIVRTIAL